MVKGMLLVGNWWWRHTVTHSTSPISYICASYQYVLHRIMLVHLHRENLVLFIICQVKMAQKAHLLFQAALHIPTLFQCMEETLSGFWSLFVKMITVLPLSFLTICCLSKSSKFRSPLDTKNRGWMSINSVMTSCNCHCLLTQSLIFTWWEFSW